MPALSIDFGIFIAYLIPGFLGLLALSFRSEAARQLINRLDASEKRVLSTFTVLSLSLVTGMFLSMVRHTVVDTSFSRDLPGKGPDLPHFTRIESVSPDYVKYVHEGTREAFMAAERAEKRPHQFYGNMCLACVLLAGCWLTRSRWSGIPGMPRKLGVVLLVLAIITSFYLASRLSYYRYAKAVRDLNAYQTPPSKE